VALDDPALNAKIGPLLDAGYARLKARGYAARSGWLSSPTTGGGSWLAQSTLMSGVWINNQQRYRELVSSDRLTLNGAFRRAGWRTVAVMPATVAAWPEGKFFNLDRIYAARDLGYRGPGYAFNMMPDQYTLSAFQRFEMAAPGHPPVMAEIPLISSHSPWEPVPPMKDWQAIGDGSGYVTAPGNGDAADIVLRRDPDRVRADYANAISYSLTSLISYVETYGNDDMVMVFLGDHQPSTVVTGSGASREVPITILAKDQAVLDRVAGWDWQDGLKPAADGPVWRMDTFRDRFLTAFGSTPQ
jgi:Sulfatase